MSKGKINLLDPIGQWVVSTEGDEEGKTREAIATETGHLGEIALKYAGRALRALTLSPPRVEPIGIPKPGRSALISLSGCFDGSKAEMVEAMQEFLGNNWVVRPTNYFMTVEIARAEDVAALWKTERNR